MTTNGETRAGRLASALDEFVRSSPEVVAAAVVSFDGLPMATALPSDMEEDRLGAMSAALLSLGEQATLGLGRGQLNQVFVEGEHGFVFLMSAEDEAVLTAVATRDAKIGFMLYEMRRAAAQVGAALRLPMRTEATQDPAHTAGTSPAAPTAPASAAPTAPAPTALASAAPAPADSYDPPAPQGHQPQDPGRDEQPWSDIDRVMTIPDDVGALFGDHSARSDRGDRGSRQG